MALSKMKKRLEKLRGRRGISPVIATVLLVAMVIVIALIIFMWFKSFSQESITKFGGENVQTVCQEVSFSADYSGGQILLSNTGNVPIYSVVLKVSAGGNYQTNELSTFTGGSNWPKTGLRIGGTYASNSMGSSLQGASQVLVIPVLLGSSNSGQQTYTCPDQYGQEISVS